MFLKQPFILLLFTWFVFPVHAQEVTIIFKLKPGTEIFRKRVINDLANTNVLVPGVSIIKKFPGERSLSRVVENDKRVDVSLIYEVKCSPGESAKVIKQLLASGNIDYAEEKHIPQLAASSSDPMLSQQYALEKMQALSAWDVLKGDTNVVIGIADTGVDMDHEDLAGNIKFNYNDPVNGLDDDGDGYIDNFSGWDLGENDNDPQLNSSTHGAWITGIAAGVTDNGKGIASAGFNVKFLPIKIDSAGILIQAYEGIKYAADHGCSIINCSWGEVKFSQFGQDMVNYATFNKGALVVAAAGNGINNTAYYPAAMENVFAISLSDKEDKLPEIYNYSEFVDVLAPGQSINTTTDLGYYAVKSGTSLSCANASAAAALVKSRFPAFLPVQVEEQLKATADDVYSINDGFLVGKLGTGRINLFRAVSDSAAPGIVMIHKTAKDGNDNEFFAGELFDISGTFKNYLFPSSASVTLSCTSPYISVIDSVIDLQMLNTMDSVNTENNPFKVFVSHLAPSSSEALFKITITSGNYKRVAYFREKIKGTGQTETLFLGSNFPNPAKDVNNVEIFIPTNGPTELAVFDVSGRLIEKPLNGTFSKGTYFVRLDITTYPDGIYFYRLVFNEEIKTGKMVVFK